MKTRIGSFDWMPHRACTRGMVQAVRDFEPNHYHLAAIQDRLDKALAEDPDKEHVA